MNVLITGGSGYLAGWMAEYFSSQGAQVTLVSSSVDRTDLSSLVSFKKISWDDEGLIKEILDGKDLVIHAAGMNAQNCFDDPEGAAYFNGEITSRLVKLSNLVNVPRLIYLSTAHVYKNPLCGTINESTIPQNHHPYATSHLKGEQYVLNRNKLGSLEGVVVRLSNVYGSPVNGNVNCWSLFVNDLCKQVIEYQAMTIKSNVMQKRDFISIGEVCRLVFSISRAEIGINQRIINLGLGQANSLIDIARRIQERSSILFGYSPKIVQLNKSVERVCDLNYQSNVIKELGFCVNDDIEISIDKLLKFCANNFRNIRGSTA
jgi:UDP-glucose 4-epimerase